MNNIIEIKSKYFVSTSSGKTIFNLFMNIAMIIVLIISIISLVFTGFSIHVLGQICLAGLMILVFSNRKGQYLITIADIGVDNGVINIGYKNVEFKKNMYKNVFISIVPSSLSKLEYSDKLFALRFVGNIEKKIEGSTTKALNEWIFYVEKDATKSIINNIENCTNLKIDFIDRK